jgi:hypothetical protein
LPEKSVSAVWPAVMDATVKIAAAASATERRKEAANEVSLGGFRQRICLA